VGVLGVAGPGGRSGPLPRRCPQCRPPGRARRPPFSAGAGRVVHGSPRVEDDPDLTQSDDLLLHHGPNE